MKDLAARYLAAKRRLFDRYYEADLNPEQRRAVCTVDGPLLILAGAGSGKTTVLVRRIVHLIKYGNGYDAAEIPEGMTEADVRDMERAAELPPEAMAEILPEFIHEPCPPWAVLAITFTNKAAREIRERLRAAFSDSDIAEEIWAGTFHAICMRILRRYGDRVGVESGFSIYDPDECKRVMLGCMERLGIEEKMLPVRQVLHAIGRAKDRLLSPSEMPAGDLRARHIAALYEAYEKQLAANNALDFDDIILKTVRLLDTREEVRNYYQDRFRYVSVDEFQDTNEAQFRLVELLSGKRRNIMVVGDDDQSIYKFRGATVENILHFDRKYPDAQVIKLEQNYRSTRRILAAANAVISHNRDRHPKALWSAAEEGEPIVLAERDTQEEEAEYILNKIMEMVVHRKRRYRDFAVLYRLNELSRTLESAFAKSGIPYRVLGGQRFYDRKEIRDLIAYLAVIANGRDNQKLKRIINEPKRKIGPGTVDAAEAIALREGVPMLTVLSESGLHDALRKAAPRLTEFVRMIDGLRTLAASEPVSELIRAVLERTGYGRMLEEEGEEGATRRDSVAELISASIEYEKRAGATASLTGFLEEVALVSDVDKYDESADAVVLMTIHSAKGLEFPVVFLTGMEEGIFPGTQCLIEPEELSEERRLAYVAITRAKEALYLTCARGRLLYGRTQYNPISRFVSQEIPPELVRREEGTSRFGSGFRHTGGAYAARPSYQARPVSPHRGEDGGVISDEFRRRSTAAAGAARCAAGRPELLPDGTRVRHSVFGEGEILTHRDMGGDILYEVRFANGTVKKLMATYAHLEVLL